MALWALFLGPESWAMVLLAIGVQAAMVAAAPVGKLKKDGRGRSGAQIDGSLIPKGSI